MNEVAHMLAELADDARSYDVLDAVLVRARRRARQRRVLLVATAAGLVVTAAAWLSVAGPRADRGQPVGDPGCPAVLAESPGPGAPTGTRPGAGRLTEPCAAAIARLSAALPGVLRDSAPGAALPVPPSLVQLRWRTALPTYEADAVAVVGGVRLTFTIQLYYDRDEPPVGTPMSFGPSGEPAEPTLYRSTNQHADGTEVSVDVSGPASMDELRTLGSAVARDPRLTLFP